MSNIAREPPKLQSELASQHEPRAQDHEDDASNEQQPPRLAIHIRCDFQISRGWPSSRYGTPRWS